jgi:RNA polymerase sigma-70 factor (ECF subfamily)
MKDFEDAYRRFVDPVFRYAVRCVGRRDIAEEITSDTFLALYENLDTIDMAQLPGWLFTVVRNRAMDFFRRQALEQQYLRAQPVSPAAAEDSHASLYAWLARNSALRPVHRICLILRYVHGMRRSEIARYTGLSETQVKGHLQYAHRLLRQQLART